LYGQDKFQQAIDIYEPLLQELDEQDPMLSEVQVNLLAAKAGLGFLQPKADGVVDVDGLDYSGCEVTYNSASIHLAQGNYTRAAELLELARSKLSLVAAIKTQVLT
jgi:tetratricopeptide (TPR) repeat protein